MANVLFKQGTQENLDAIRTAKSATEGTFYLTNDSHRMYLGIASGDAVPVNEGVTTVRSLSDLPKNYTAQLHAGQFYYVTQENILCVFNGTNWAQINSNTDTYIEKIEYAITEVVDQDNVVSVNLKIYDDKGGGDYLEKAYKIKGADGLLVDVDASGDIVLTGDSYGLSTSYSNVNKTASIHLASQNTDNDTQIDIKGNDNLTISRDANGAFTFASKDTKLAEVSSGLGESPTDSSDDKEGLYVNVKDTDGEGGAAHLNPEFQVGTTPTYYEKVKIINGVASLPVYSKREVDKMMVGLDAMSYKGTLGPGGSKASLDTTSLSNGDTYLLAGSWSQPINGVTYTGKKGDMVICRGTEGANGFLTSTTIVVDVVPSGDDAMQDTTYTVVPIDKGFQIVASGGDSVGGMTVIGDGTHIEVTDSKNASTGFNTLTVKHKKITEKTSSLGTTTQSNYINLPITVVESIVRDAAGHITEVKTRTYNLKDTNGHLDDIATYGTTLSTVDGATKVLITSQVKMYANNGDPAGVASGAFSIESKSISISTPTAGGAAVVLELEWGTF